MLNILDIRYIRNIINTVPIGQRSYHLFDPLYFYFLTPSQKLQHAPNIGTCSGGELKTV